MVLALPHTFRFMAIEHQGRRSQFEKPARVVLRRSSGDPSVAHDVQRPRRSAAPVHSCSITSEAARTAVRPPTPCPASIWV